jgi:predicted kinase
MNGDASLRAACLVVLVGHPGSGKSTWAKQNGRGAIHVSQDGLIGAISPHGFEHVNRPVYAAAEDAVAQTALRHGHTVIVDRTNRTRAHRGRWLRLARDLRCPAVAVVMTADSSLCRLRNRNRNGSDRLSEGRMERMLAAFEPVEAEEGFTAVYRDDAITLAEILMEIKEMAIREEEGL